MKKTAGIILALAALMVFTGCPREPEAEVPGKTPITVDENTPFNPVFADIEKEEYIPYKSVSEFQFEETDYSYNGNTVYRLKGTYIFKAGDNYWLDGNYDIEVLNFQVGSMKFSSDAYTRDMDGFSYKKTGIDFSNHVFSTATDADWITYENELYLKYSVKLNDDYTWKFITKDGDELCFFFENDTDVNAFLIIYGGLNPTNTGVITEFNVNMTYSELLAQEKESFLNRKSDHKYPVADTTYSSHPSRQNVY